MSDDPTLKSIDVKLTMFMESQKEVNNTVSKAIEHMASTAIKSESMQVEMNGQSERINDLSHKVSGIDKKVHELSEQVVVNKLLVSQTQDLKKMFTKAMVGVFFMFLCSLGVQLMQNQQKNEYKNVTFKEVAELLKAKN